MIKFINFIVSNIIIFIMGCLLVFKFRFRDPIIVISFDIFHIFIYFCNLLYLVFALSVLLNDIFQFLIPRESKIKFIIWCKQKLKRCGQIMQNILHLVYFSYIHLKFNSLMITLILFWAHIQKYHRRIHFIFISLPPIIVGTSYFYDVVLKKEFYYFPRMVFILIIPFILTIIVWMLKFETWALIQQINRDIDLNNPKSDINQLLNIEQEEFLYEQHEMRNLATIVNLSAKQFLQGWIEKKICLIIRHSLFLISFGYLIYYMFMK